MLFISKGIGRIGYDWAMFNYQLDNIHSIKDGGMGFMLMGNPIFSLSWKFMEYPCQVWFRIFGVGLQVRNNSYKDKYGDLFEFEVPLAGLILAFLPNRPVRFRRYKQ